MQLERLVVEIDADPRDLSRGMREMASETADAAEQVEDVGEGVEEAGRKFERGHLSLRRLTGSLSDMAGEAAGLDPKVRKIAETLSEFALGGAVTLGVVAGLAYMAHEWKSFNDVIEAFDKDVEGVAKRLDELANKKLFGGQFQAFQDKNTALGQIADIQAQMAGPQARIAQLQAVPAAFRLGGIWDKQLKDAQEELGGLTIELNTWKRRLKTADDALLEAIPSIEGITVTGKRLEERLRDMALELRRKFGAVGDRSVVFDPRVDGSGGLLEGKISLGGRVAGGIKLPPADQMTHAISGYRAEVQGAADDTKMLADGVMNLAEIGGSALVGFFSSAEGGWKAFADGAVAEIQRIVAKLLAVAALKAIFAGATGGVGGAVLAALEPRAGGGPVAGGRPYLVGERGPELFVPASSGAIMPNGGGGGWAAAAAALGPVPRPQTPREVARDAWYREFIRLAVTDNAERS